MKKVFLAFAMAIVMVFVAAPQAKAQSWGVGLKAGWDYGLNIKKYNGANDLEFVAAFHNHGFRVDGLYEWNKDLGSGFKFYYGLGATVGMWRAGDKDDGTDLGLAVDGILGIEWHLPNNIPFTLALDWMPSFEILPSTDFWAKGLAFSVKYVF